MRHILILAALCALPVASFAQQGPRLAGAYDCQSPDGPAVLNFESTRTLSYGGVQMAYRILGTAIQVIQDGLPVNYAFQQQGDRLDITTPEGDRIACVKAGTAAKNAAPGGSPGAGANALLQGQLCAWSGSSGGGSSYSSTQRAWFDGRGRFSTGSESSFSGQYRDSGGNDLGSASAYGGGNGPGGSYQVTSAQVGAPIQIRWDDGSQDVAYVHFVAGGRITEIKYGKSLFGAGLCE